MLTVEQKKFFDTFGFLVLRQDFSPDEMKLIVRDYELLMTQALGDQGKSREVVAEHISVEPGFCERATTLRTLSEDPRIRGVAEELLAPGTFYAGSDGHLYCGDTGWHPDLGWHPGFPKGQADPNFKAVGGHYYPGVKVALYIDPVGSTTGCLRVIPGSHLNPFHDALASLHCQVPEQSPQLLDDPCFKRFGVEPDEVSAYAIESLPGDVVFFSHQLWHASFGGSNGRRMFALAYKAAPSNEGQRQLAEHYKAKVQDCLAEYGTEFDGTVKLKS